MSIKHFIERNTAAHLIDTAICKINKNDREAEFVKILNQTEKYLKNVKLDVNYSLIRSMLQDENSAINKYLNRLFDEVDPTVLQRSLLNFGYEAMINGTKTIRKMRELHKCNIPWLILMDPTSACNLHCTGCWAAEYGNKLNLSYDELSDIVKQGKRLGVYLYMFTGGEPLVRKDDIIRLCEEHKDCQFLAFTNGTLVDQKFCNQMKLVGNLMLAISLEGFSDVNDLRRGTGVFEKVMKAMDLLHENGLLFGTSICYTSKNYKAVTSEEFINLMISKGCRYAMYFHYMPVGNDASMDLLLSPEQRVYIKDRIRQIRKISNGEGLFTMDFQNDGEYVGGCIAGGRNYFHINANGDAEPCVFIHYSDSNIREKSLLEILKSPLFMEYHKNQPFNENHLRPCPMLENPEKLKAMVNSVNAKSTDLQSMESVEHLCDKCMNYAREWGVCADAIWNEEYEY